MKTELVIDLEAEKKEILKRYRALLRASKSTLQKGDKKERNERKEGNDPGNQNTGK